MEQKKIDICIPSLVKNDRVYEEKVAFLKSIGIPVNNILVSDKKGRAKARNDLMSRVTTDWFLFLDDDVIINKKWWIKISKYIDNDRVGAINGFGLTKSLFLTILRHLLLLRGIKHQRGFTSNTLIKKKAVEGIKLTREDRFEDFELQEKVRANGYQWKFCFAYCKHTKKPSEVFKDSLCDFKRLKKEKGLIKAIMSI